MKKILTLLAAITITAISFAQAPDLPSRLNFIGGSTYTATVMGMTISGSGDNDTITVTDNYSSIIFPDMNVLFYGQTMTVPSMKITDVTYTITGNPLEGTAIITWDKGATDTIVNVYVATDGEYENKKLQITSLHATFTQATKALSVTYLFKYGSMPGTVTFTETGYYRSSIIGDVNNDDTIDNADLTAIADVICGITNNTKADVNNDNAINIKDINTTIATIRENASK